MRIIIETERLSLREFVPEDLEALAPIFADVEMMRFYREPFSRERTQSWIDWNMRAYQAYGHGLWAVIRKNDGLFLGDCGIVRQEFDGQVGLEIGYHIRRDQWGHSYASEAARSCLRYAFDVLDAPQVVSIVDPQNTASRRVAEKTHQSMRTFFWDKNGQEMCLYVSRRA